MNTNYITLKWGTLKSWNLKGNEEGIKLLQRYSEIGSLSSAMMQRDTPTQKAIICKLIELMLGEVYLDWEDKYVSQKEAKRYVLDYDKKAAAGQ